MNILLQVVTDNSSCKVLNDVHTLHKILAENADSKGKILGDKALVEGQPKDGNDNY